MCNIRVIDNIQVGHVVPEETTYIEQRIGLHIGMVTVNGWCKAGGESLSDANLPFTIRCEEATIAGVVVHGQ